MKAIHIVALVLVIIGAVNWGLVGLFQFDLVANILGGATAPGSRVVYILVGIAGIIVAVTTAAMIEPGMHKSHRMTNPDSRTAASVR